MNDKLKKSLIIAGLVAVICAFGWYLGSFDASNCCTTADSVSTVDSITTESNVVDIFSVDTTLVDTTVTE